jgi:hypothetical protein
MMSGRSGHKSLLSRRSAQTLIRNRYTGDDEASPCVTAGILDCNMRARQLRASA